MSLVLTLAIPAFVILMALEALYSRGRGGRGYELRDTVASLAMGISNRAVTLLSYGVTIAVVLTVSEYALFDLGNAWWVWLLLIPAEDFCYYWFHRTHHEIRILWAAHVNHHSSRHYNLSTALRQSWATPFTAPIFVLPLPLIGFEPAMIAVATAINLIYQFWLHTELIGRLGPLEWVLNTPSHHRVHHGRNPEYLDRNYGGIFIIWDRLFGTFEPERAPVDYGLTENLQTFHPVRIVFHEWIAMARDVLSASRPAEALRYIVGRPGWRAHGNSKTTAELREQAELAVTSSPR